MTRGIVVKRGMKPDDLKDYLARADHFLSELTQTDGQPTRLYDYQVKQVVSQAPLSVWEKARSVGFSFGIAARAVAEAHLDPGSLALIVSLNLEEAKEKIRYARGLWDSLPPEVKAPLTVDRKLELEFRNGSRILAVFQPRGKQKAKVYVDEHAHYAQDRAKDVVTSDALPILSRGGFLMIGSTVLGKVGTFHDIATNAKDRYPDYKRYRIYWWDCPDLCVDVEAARREAPGMPTVERVQRFGTARLRLIFRNMPLEDFLQEYELVYLDETTAYYPWDLILAATMAAGESGPPEPFPDFDTLLANTRGSLFAGYDVGRTRNTSELTVAERLGDVLYERGYWTYDNWTFRSQRAELEDLLRKAGSRLVRLCIDRQGIGMNLAEDLNLAYGSRVEGVAMTNPIKERMAIQGKVELEARTVRLFPDRDRQSQLHSVKKTILPSGAARYDCERNADHHADKAWSWLLTVWAATGTIGKPANLQDDVGFAEQTRAYTAYQGDY